MQGPAVWALRAQTDKIEYATVMRRILEATPNLFLREGMAVDLDIGPNDEARVHALKLLCRPFCPAFCQNPASGLERDKTCGAESDGGAQPSRRRAIDTLLIHAADTEPCASPPAIHFVFNLCETLQSKTETSPAAAVPDRSCPLV